MKRIIIALFVIAVGVGLLRAPIMRATTGVAHMTVRIVNSTGTVLDGVASAVTGTAQMTVNVVGSSGKILDSMAGSVCANSTTPVSSGSGCNVQSLTSTQIKALTTPITILSAPPSGTYIQPLNVVLSYTFGTHVYQNFAPGFALIYAGGSFSGGTVTSGYKLTDSSIVSNAPESQVAYFAIPSTILATVAVAPNLGMQLIADATGGYNAGPIATASIGAAGTGYSNTTQGVIDPSAVKSNADANYHVLTVGGGGAVATFSVTAAGNQYYPGSTYATDDSIAGAGTGFTVTVNTVTSGDGTLKVYVYYQIVTL